MALAVNTDFLSSTGSPEVHLKAIAEAGFTHLHWCHQWDTDFLYSRSEWEQYARCFHVSDLKLLNIHGSQRLVNAGSFWRNRTRKKAHSNEH